MMGQTRGSRRGGRTGRRSGACTRGSDTAEAGEQGSSVDHAAPPVGSIMRRGPRWLNGNMLRGAGRLLQMMSNHTTGNVSPDSLAPAVSRFIIGRDPPDQGATHERARYSGNE
jgi:hypothetical protein